MATLTHVSDEPVVQPGAGEPDALERLWTPHRMAYIRGENKPGDGSQDQCPFCRVPGLDDVDGLVVHRGTACFVVLNLYPYSSGHLMVCPYRHVADYTAHLGSMLFNGIALGTIAALVIYHGLGWIARLRGGAVETPATPAFIEGDES